MFDVVWCKQQVHYANLYIFSDNYCDDNNNK